MCVLDKAHEFNNFVKCFINQSARAEKKIDYNVPIYAASCFKLLSEMKEVIRTSCEVRSLKPIDICWIVARNVPLVTYLSNLSSPSRFGHIIVIEIHFRVTFWTWLISWHERPCFNVCISGNIFEKSIPPAFCTMSFNTKINSSSMCRLALSSNIWRDNSKTTSGKDRY